MQYRVVCGSDGAGTVWVAEGVREDGIVYSAIFVGRDAKERAEEYVAWKNEIVSSARMAKREPRSAA
jgi:hypothetical protein